MNSQVYKNIPETFWQKNDTIIGPACSTEFEMIGQQDTRKAIEDFIVRNSHTSTKLLDAGCNTGVEGYRLMKSNYLGQYIGVDSNLKALQYAMQNLAGTSSSFALADLGNIPFPDRSFDIVLNKDVIEHASYYEDIIRELTRLTSKFLILSMFIKLNNRADVIKLEPGGFYHNSYESKKFFSFIKCLGMSDPVVIFENQTDQVLLFTKN